MMAGPNLARLVAAVLLGAALCAAQPGVGTLDVREAQPHARPYMASVQVNGTHRCGGALLSAKWVLSAAHCLEEGAPELPQVLLGAHSLSEPEPSTRLYDVSRAVRHPYSRPGSLENDLILLQLAEEAALGRAVRPLPWQQEDRELPPGTRCDVAGWGVGTPAESDSVPLLEEVLPLLDFATCNLRALYGGVVGRDGRVTERLICTELRRLEGCRGDSGSPLVCGGVLEGVGTSGRRRVCGDPRGPGIYTRVSSYAPWIRSVLEDGAGN